MRGYTLRTALAYTEELTRYTPTWQSVQPWDNPGYFLALLFPRRQSARQARLQEPGQQRPEGNIFQFTSSTFMNTLSYKGPQRNLFSTLELPQ